MPEDVSGYLIKPDCNEETGQVSWVRIPLNSKSIWGYGLLIIYENLIEYLQ